MQLREKAPAVGPATAGVARAPCAPLYVPSSPEDEAFLDELQHRIFNYFWDEVYPETGIAIDHTQNRTGKVAATGFELAAICIGVERGWITRDEGYQRALQILNMFRNRPEDQKDAGRAEGHFGLWWHFVDGRTGKMIPVDCVAMCDSADLVAGMIVAGEYFKGTEVEELAREIYDNVQWDQFVMKKSGGEPGLLSFGWVPLHVSQSYYDTDGLLTFGMSGFVDNSLLIYVLAMGSDTHPIPQATWEEYVNSYTMGEYEGFECLMVGQLFCRQVPASFVDFSRKRDRKIDYFQDMVYALLADRAFNIKENGYPPELWGLTDVFGKDSYSHSGPPGPVQNDGTIGTTAFVGALPHVPSLALEAMRYVRETFGDRVWGKYGFTSSVNPKNDFVSPLFVGIELGPMMQLIENYRTGLIWDLFSRSRAMQNFVQRTRMSGVVDDFELPPEAPAYASWSAQGGAAELSTDQPQHGRRCLAIRTRAKTVRLSARLPANDLLRFHYDKFLSLWTRDLRVTACRILLDGREVELKPVGELPGDGWDHACFELPAHSETSAVCGLTFEAEVRGRQPAVDNVTFEAAGILQAPEAVRELTAVTGRIGGSVNLTWTAPGEAGTRGPARYVVLARPIGTAGEVKRIDLGAVKAPGEREDRTILLDSGKRYSVAVAAMDQAGHLGPSVTSVDVDANPETFRPVAYDFESGSLDGWGWSDTNWVARIERDGTNTCLRVDFKKSHAWNHLLARLDPAMVALHRYITVRVKGRVEILGKLWSAKDLEQDMEAKKSTSDTEWTTLTFDTRRAGMIVPDRDLVRMIILFPQPGQWMGGGTFWLDDVGYSNE